MNVAVSTSGRRWLWVTFWILVVFLYAPLVILLIFSFNDRELVSFPWEGFTLRWYRTFLDNPEIPSALRASLFVAAATAIVTTILAIPASIALVRRRFFAKGLVSGMMLAPLVIPLVVMGTALLILFNLVGIEFSLITIAIGHIVIALPFAILILVPRLERIPAALEDASRDLGAGWFVTFRLITFPLLLPAVFSAFLLSFVISFDEVVMATFLAGDQVTFPVYLYSQLRLPRQLPQVIAVAVVILVISAIVVTASEVFRRVADRRLESQTAVHEEEVPVV
ncbi:MAG: ABC transporter permease [Actinomycetota bacterium]|nr:ABC transporter permease [Actinomycetota bacterium]